MSVCFRLGKERWTVAKHFGQWFNPKSLRSSDAESRNRLPTRMGLAEPVLTQNSSQTTTSPTGAINCRGLCAARAPMQLLEHFPSPHPTNKYPGTSDQPNLCFEFRNFSVVILSGWAQSLNETISVYSLSARSWPDG